MPYWVLLNATNIFAYSVLQSTVIIPLFSAECNVFIVVVWQIIGTKNTNKIQYSVMFTLQWCLQMSVFFPNLGSYYPTSSERIWDLRILTHNFITLLTVFYYSCCKFICWLILFGCCLVYNALLLINGWASITVYSEHDFISLTLFLNTY